MSCKKDKVQINHESNPDEIMFVDIPDIVLSSTDSVYYIPFGPGCPVASPEDSTAEYNIDIDGNGIDDFTISMTHWYEFVSASSPCANYNYRISILGIINENKIATTNHYNEVAKFNLNQDIGASLNWNNSASILMQVTTAPFSTNFNGSAYIGLKLGAGADSNYGWLLIDKVNYAITIKEMAINLTNTNSIKAGQIE